MSLREQEFVDLTEKVRAMADEFTPLERDDEDEPLRYFNVIWLPTKKTCWRFLLCEWHMNEHLALNWKFGGTGRAWGFHTYEEFCQVCDAFEREAKHVNPISQTAQVEFSLDKGEGFLRRMYD